MNKITGYEHAYEAYKDIVYETIDNKPVPLDKFIELVNDCKTIFYKLFGHLINKT